MVRRRRHWLILIERRRKDLNAEKGIVNLSQIPVWSKTSSSLPVFKTLKFFNGDEFIEGTEGAERDLPTQR
jgi:hypothetical protein